MEIQDEGSQLVAALLGAAPEMRVVDWCAGAGGKTLAIAALMQNRGHLVACDVSAPRLESAVRRLRRAAGMTASAWKTSAGAAARVPVAQVVNLTRQLKAYQAAGCMVIGLAADGDVSLSDLELATGPLVIVVGSEGKGLSRLVADTCDQLVSIPMASSLESLNAGVAASVALYAVARERAQHT